MDLQSWLMRWWTRSRKWFVTTIDWLWTRWTQCFQKLRELFFMKALLKIRKNTHFVASKAQKYIGLSVSTITQKRWISRKLNLKLEDNPCSFENCVRGGSQNSSQSTKQLLDSSGWEIICHLDHIPDLEPSDFHLFASLKSFMGGKRFSTDNEV